MTVELTRAVQIIASQITRSLYIIAGTMLTSLLIINTLATGCSRWLLVLTLWFLSLITTRLSTVAMLLTRCTVAWLMF